MSLRAYYKCDEVNGDLIDEVDGAPLTASGSPVYRIAAPFGFGVAASTLTGNFAGVNSIFNLGGGDADWSFTGWLKRAAGNVFFLTKGVEDFCEFILGYNIGGLGLTKVVYNSLISSDGEIDVDAWGFVSLVYTTADTTCRVKVNNGSPALVVPGLLVPGTNQFNIGTGVDAWGFHELTIWDNALTDAEVTSLFGGGSPIQVEGGKWRTGQAYSDGLKAGQPVVATGAGFLGDGDRVRVVAASAGRAPAAGASR